MDASRAGVRNYLLVTFAYWGFTLTDGAIRMLVVLYFEQLGYTPLAIASLFLFYEFFGVVTNFFGGWLAARMGLNSTLYSGMLLQIVALSMLAVEPGWLSVAYVMFAQALSGIAKDLNKMSAKSSIKLFLPEAQHSRLFHWVALLTGSKNTLKGIGFFLGGLLLALLGFQGALWALAAGLGVVLLVTAVLLPRRLGAINKKAKLKQWLSPNHAINRLSLARLFLFGARDVWFVVGVPVYLTAVAGWDFEAVGAFMALWVVGYGVVQAATPRLLPALRERSVLGLLNIVLWLLVVVTAALGLAVQQWGGSLLLVLGLVLFGTLFAATSSIHSWLIVAYADSKRLAQDVGFYYMANAGGRLTGTVFSGLSYQYWGLFGCLITASLFLLISALLSRALPVPHEGAKEDSDTELGVGRET